MTATVVATGVGSRFTARAWRGVAWELTVALRENIGTESQPIKGDPLDLTLWPFLVGYATPEGLPGVRIAVEVDYTFADPATLFLRIAGDELDKAVTDNECLHSIRLTVVAGQTDRSERVLLTGNLDLLESGWTEVPV